MSRVGKNPVEIPEGVTVDIAGQNVTAKGKLGELSLVLSDEVEASRDGDQIWLKPRNEELSTQKVWGTSRSLVNNMISGVNEGFTRNLEITGVGYRAQVQGKELIMQLGLSHEIRFSVPEGIDIKCSDQNHI